MPLFGKTIDLLSHMLDFRAARHKVIVSNIANLDTPDYKPRDLLFETNLSEAMGKGDAVALSRTQAKHLSSFPGRGGHFQVSQTGDKVEIDKEMTNLAENNLTYNLTVELLARKFKGIDTVLRETK